MLEGKDVVSCSGNIDVRMGRWEVSQSEDRTRLQTRRKNFLVCCSLDVPITYSFVKHVVTKLNFVLFVDTDEVRTEMTGIPVVSVDNLYPPAATADSLIEPILKTNKLTLEASLALILSYIRVFKLSNEAIDSLLELISLIAIKHLQLPSNFYQLKALVSQTADLSEPVKHMCCENAECGHYLNSDAADNIGTCDSCSPSNDGGSAKLRTFVSLSVKLCLRRLVEVKKFV